MLLLIFIGTIGALAQSTITGTVEDKSGEPVIGASVLVKGSKLGTSTNIDGEFSITIPKDKATLVFSYVGCKTQELPAVNGMKVVMQEDANLLDEVVVVGYGTQRKSVVTAAISKIGADELAQTAPVRIDNALKGLTSGVTVTSANGQPGEGSQIRVRGVGTINNSSPLYIVDGMPIDGGIDYLNPSDIKSIEVLKDAASGAVYGARAANGVILVTTKNGSSGRAHITYDFSYGWQSVAKKTKMMNATEYVLMKQEGYTNAGQTIPEHLRMDPYSVGEGFDWQDAIFYDGAPVQSHQVSVSGGNDRGNYFLSMGYYDQKGIVGGNYGHSAYRRFSLRSNNNYTFFDESMKRNFLNKLTFNANVAYARIESNGVSNASGSYYGGALTNALGMSPLMTPTMAPGSEGYNHQTEYFATNTKYVPRYDENGNLYTVPEAFGGGFQELTNPLQSFSYPAGKNWSHKIVLNVSADLQIWDALKYRISFGGDLAFWGSDSHSEPNYYGPMGNLDALHASASSSWNRGWTWQLENVLTYDKTFDGHHINVMLGQTSKEATGWWINASANKLYDFGKPWVTVAQGQPGEADGGNRTGNAGPNTAWPRLLSYFGRASYDYDGRYMAQVTVRRDGSSRFGANNKWATFPSFSLGWNPTNEKFLQNRPWWWTNTKVRFSWGKNGNESIGDFAYTVLAAGGNNYYFGPEGSSQAYGSKASGLPNPNLKWEESSQTDIGLDFGFFSNSLQFTIDYYYKKTDGMLMTMQIPTYVGESKPTGNVGSMENKGLEMELRWNHSFGDWNVNLGGNLSYNKNKLIKLGNENGWRTEQSNGTAGDIARSEDGEVFPYFYGYKTAGVFQNQAQADAYNEKYGLTASQGDWFARPGDLIWVDTNNDGKINADDRTKLGKGLPDWVFGFNLGAEWKGISLTAYFQGVWGNKIYDASLRGDTPGKNMPRWMLDRWTGEGSGNRLPLFRLGDTRNWKSSDIYLNDGAYLRCSNITLSYTLPRNIINKIGFDNFRVFVMGENVFTLTKYRGFTPEIGSGTGIGIDYGVYPLARTWTVGFNVSI